MALSATQSRAALAEHFGIGGKDHALVGETFSPSFEGDQPAAAAQTVFGSERGASLEASQKMGNNLHAVNGKPDIKVKAPVHEL